jgi:hypothetical protein
MGRAATMDTVTWVAWRPARSVFVPPTAFCVAALCHPLFRRYPAAATPAARPVTHAHKKL